MSSVLVMSLVLDSVSSMDGVITTVDTMKMLELVVPLVSSYTCCIY